MAPKPVPGGRNVAIFCVVSDGLSGQRRYSDDEFDRALRELAEGTAAEPRFREASAAERHKQARQQAKRARKQAGRRSGRRGGRGRGRATALTSLIVALVLAAAGGLVWLESRHPSTATAGRPVVPTVSADAPPALPFAGTPARDWADGAAGIAVPAAKPVGDFTAAQVAAAYQTTRALLIAGDLNEQTLLGGRPTAFADLLAARQRAQFLGGLNRKGVGKNGFPLSTRIWVTSFAPASAELIGNVIKVRGTMSAGSVHLSGTTALAVTVNYLFVYAIERPGDPADWMRIVTHRRGRFDFAPWNDPGGPLTPWNETTAGQAGALCGSTDGYQHPDYPSERGPGPHPSPSGAAIDPYSFTAAVPVGVLCGRSTGT
jgi:hypothetical protein